jgi:hypothetical protein
LETRFKCRSIWRYDGKNLCTETEGSSPQLIIAMYSAVFYRVIRTQTGWRSI